MENTLRNESPHISRISTRNGTRVLLACSALIVLASCSADQAASTDSEGTGANNPAPSASSPSSAPAPSSAAASAAGTPLAEPLSPESKLQPYPAEELVLSEQGTSAGTYAVEGGLKEGDSITIAVTCSPGGTLGVKTDPILPAIEDHDCANGPIDVNISDPAAAGKIPDLSVTVETSNGGSFWLQARVHNDA